jgi:hypothetical protein
MCLSAKNDKESKNGQLPYKIDFQVSPDTFPKNSDLRVELRAFVCIRDERTIKLVERPIFGRHEADPNEGAVTFDRHTLATRSTEPLVWNISFGDGETPTFDGPQEWDEFILPFDPAIAKAKTGTAVVFAGNATLTIDGKLAATMQLRSPMTPWRPARSGGWGLKVENKGTVSLLDNRGNVVESTTTIHPQFFSPPSYNFEIIVLPNWASDMQNKDGQ